MFITWYAIKATATTLVHSTHGRAGTFRIIELTFDDCTKWQQIAVVTIKILNRRHFHGNFRRLRHYLRGLGRLIEDRRWVPTDCDTQDFANMDYCYVLSQATDEKRKYCRDYLQCREH